MKKWTLGGVRKTNPIQTQFKANQSQYKANTKPIQTQFKPKRTQFQSQYMLPCLKINTRPNPLGYSDDEIQAPNAYNQEKAGNRINSILALDLLHSTEKRAKIRIVFRFDRLSFT